MNSIIGDGLKHALRDLLAHTGILDQLDFLMLFLLGRRGKQKLLDNLRRVVGGVEMEVDRGIIAVALFLGEMHVKAAYRRGLMIPLAWRFYCQACCF